MALGLMVLAGIGCGGGGAGPAPASPRATAVTVSGVTPLAALGQTVQLAASVRDASGAEMQGVAVVWTSSSPDIATVSAEGLVTAVGNGTAAIRAKAEGLTGSANVTVQQVAAEVRPGAATLTLPALTQTQTLSASVVDAKGFPVAGATVAWSSTNTAVASVTADGRVTAHANGTATVKATHGTLSGSTAVTVQQVPAAVTFSRPTHNFTSAGQTLDLSATLVDAALQPMPAATFTWASADAAVATVTAAGRVTAAGAGSTQVTATASGVTGAAFVRVGAPLRISAKYLVHEFVDSTVTPDYVYEGVTYKGGPVSYFAQGFGLADLWQDGRPDVFAPLMKGYASGIDTRAKPFFFKNVDGTLVEASAEVDVPAYAGSRKISFLTRPNDPFRGLFTVQHDTHDGRMGDILLVGAGTTPTNRTARIDPLPLSTVMGRPTAVNAHSMGGGDLNGDGRTDFVVGDWGTFDSTCSTCAPYFLLQRADGTWAVRKDPFLADVTFRHPLVNPGVNENNNLLLELHLADLDGDGLDDLLTGYGHGSTAPWVYFNQGDATFTRTDGHALPTPPFGVDNSLHAKTVSLDFDGDGDKDLFLVFSRYVPYYGGYAFQLLINDGAGNFRDETAQRLHSFAENEAPNERLIWSDNFQLMDVNGDGKVDLLGSHGGGADPSKGRMRVWLNVGGTLNELPVDTGGNWTVTPLQFADFGSGRLGTVAFDSGWTDAAGTATRVRFRYFEFESEIR